MSLEDALQHDWLRDLTVSMRSPPPSPKRAPPGQLPVPRHYSGSNTMNSNTMNGLGQSTHGQSTYNMSTVSNVADTGDSPIQQTTGLPEYYSQEFENLRLDGEEVNTPSQRRWTAGRV